MIRLLVITDEPDRWKSAESRLADVVIETRRAPDDQSLNFDAVLIDSGSIDSAAIASLLSSGKHVLLASDLLPLAIADCLSQTARPNRVQFVLANPDRFLPSRQLIKQQIPEKIGQPGLVRIHRWNSSRGSNYWLYDIDMALWLIGSQPSRVFATENRVREQWHVQIHLGFANGAMALIDRTNGLPTGDDYQSLSVIGSTGAAYADDHPNMQLLYLGGKPQAVRTNEKVRQAVELLQWFVSGLNAGVDLAEDTLHVGRTLLAIERSLHRKQAESLSESEAG